ncbi:MAG: site-2 protease family protein [Candidatus Omnitrophica bacterium]|nr:site-2 protease family protein [Candidatus Omnitrophota bacterium]
MNIFFLLIILFSITVHEYMHGFTAHVLGDPSPKVSGRLTLNPLVHVDPVGTIILPMLFLFSSVLFSGQPFALGYAKPMPVNPYHFKKPRRDTMWIGIAGPGINFLLALGLGLIVRTGISTPWADLLIWGIIVNLILGFFNLLPIPPLDGSRILAALLPYSLSYRYLKMEIAGFFLIVLLILSGLFDWFLVPAVRMVIGIFGIGGVI